ncbi:hypothetical protein Droror1_Dr00010100 [Drosera rotundifolia]
MEVVDKYISKEGSDFPCSISGSLGILSSVAFAFLLIPSSINVRFWTSWTVGDHSPTVHLFALLNSMLWVLYALPFVQPNNFVITSSAAGSLIAVFYLVLFAMYSKSWNENRRKVISILVLEIIVVGVTATAVFSVVQDTPSSCDMHNGF